MFYNAIALLPLIVQVFGTPIPRHHNDNQQPQPEPFPNVFFDPFKAILGEQNDPIGLLIRNFLRDPFLGFPHQPQPNFPFGGLFSPFNADDDGDITITGFIYPTTPFPSGNNKFPPGNNGAPLPIGSPLPTPIGARLPIGAPTPIGAPIPIVVPKPTDVQSHKDISNPLDAHVPIIEPVPGLTHVNVQVPTPVNVQVPTPVNVQVPTPVNVQVPAVTVDTTNIGHKIDTTVGHTIDSTVGNTISVGPVEHVPITGTQSTSTTIETSNIPVETSVIGQPAPAPAPTPVAVAVDSHVSSGNTNVKPVITIETANPAENEIPKDTVNQPQSAVAASP